MINKRLKYCCFLFFISLFLPSQSFAQTIEKAKIEAEYLAKAKVNIEKYRKGNVNLQFTDSLGKPLNDVKIEVNQISQDFLFGNLSEEIFNPKLTKQEVEKFQKYFTEIFNFTELTVKWSPYEMEQGKQQWQKLQQKLDWCKQHGITPKGHTLGWTNMSGTPPWLLKLPHELATELYKARIQNIVGGFKDLVGE